MDRFSKHSREELQTGEEIASLLEGFHSKDARLRLLFSLSICAFSLLHPSRIDRFPPVIVPFASGQWSCSEFPNSQRQLNACLS